MFLEKRDSKTSRRHLQVGNQGIWRDKSKPMLSRNQTKPIAERPVPLKMPAHIQCGKGG